MICKILLLCMLLCGVWMGSAPATNFTITNMNNSSQLTNTTIIQNTTNQTTAADTTPSKTVYRKPEMYLLEPTMRSGTNGSLVAKPPCGGITKGKVHTLVTPDSLNFIQWKTAYPSPDSNCTVLLGNGLDLDDWEVLFPLDGSADIDGKFACGRWANAHETKEFRFPKELSCEKCTLQLVWETMNGNVYQCSDITIMTGELQLCSGKCMNGGVCVNGRCVCMSDYYGDFCQYRTYVSSTKTWYYVTFIILAILIIALFALAYHFWAQIKQRIPQVGLPKPPSLPKMDLQGREKEIVKPAKNPGQRSKYDYYDGEKEIEPDYESES